MRYQFEDIEVDSATRELRRDGNPVALEPQVYDVLMVLIENRDRMVPKPELLDLVWGDRFVSESALSSRIKTARKAIGDNGRDQRLIRTVHGRGFRFVGEVTTDQEPEIASADAPVDDAIGEPVDAPQTRSLLFSDIEGSTDLWNRFADEMNLALVRHDELTTAAITANGGRVFKHTGDGFAAVFDTSDEAVSAAIAIQQSLQGVDWSPIDAMRVRVALHRGPAFEREGDLFGVGVSVAGKLLAIANGDQIIASQALTGDIADRGTADLLQPIGAFNVVGLGDHEIVHVVGVPDGRSDDRPLRAELSARTNLPRRRGQLVGRSGELTDVVQQLDRVDLVTIVGPGGVGKTTLAVDAARRALAMFPGGVWLCELGQVGPEHVAGAVLSAIEGTAGGGESVEQIVDRLGSQRALLVLDNCEHVIDEAAKLISELLERHQSVVVLATSREPLDLRGESVLRIGGLAHVGVSDEGVELFMRRATEQGLLEDGPENRDHARRIVERLEGLPLAIELAVPRLVSASASELLATLDDQLSVLASRRRHTDRQSTMADAIAWSYDLLTDNERALLRELAVFSSPFLLSAAESISSVIGVRDTLHRLVEQSMVVRRATEQGSRFRILEPIRQFVARETSSDELDALTVAHAEYFADRVRSLASQMRTPQEAEAAAMLTAEWPDVGRSVAFGLGNDRPDIAVDPLVALETHLLYQLRFEAFGWLEAAATQFPDLGPIGPQVHLLRGYGAWGAGDPAAAEQLLAMALEAADPTPLSAFLRFCLQMTGEDFGGTRDTGQQILELAVAQQEPDWTIIGTAYRLVGLVMADPTDPRVSAYAAEVDQNLEDSEWPTGACAGLLSHIARSMRVGEHADMERYRAELHRISADCRAPWFDLTAGGLAGSVTSSSASLEQLQASAKALRSAVRADNLVQLPAILRSAVIGLVGVGEFPVAAQVIGLIPEVRGLGESGIMTPGYEQAVDIARSELGGDFDDNAERGRRLELDALSDAIEAAAGAAR